jgi:hypothetical protein
MCDRFLAFNLQDSCLGRLERGGKVDRWCIGRIFRKKHLKINTLIEKNAKILREKEKDIPCPVTPK